MAALSGRSPLLIDPQLKRYPYFNKDLLQAWDAADELIVEHLQTLELAGLRILILSDHFGALTSTLAPYSITSYTDSFLSHRAFELNTPGALRSQVTLIHRLESLRGPYDLALARIPKNLSFFEDQLAHLSCHLKVGAPVIFGYRIKHEAASSFDLINRIIGPTTTRLAQKKARLIFARFSRIPSQSPYPQLIQVPPFEEALTNHSNVFSRDKLDQGTRFLLNLLPEGKFGSIVDLGCANGVIGIAAHFKNPYAQVTFCDESQMAVMSAQENWSRLARLSPSGASARFEWNDGLAVLDSASVDLVLCNPPFHQGHTVGDRTAQRMFLDSHRALNRGGLLRVIGNHHLNYPAALRRIFGRTEIVAKDHKFTIVDAFKV